MYKGSSKSSDKTVCTHPCVWVNRTESRCKAIEAGYKTVRDIHARWEEAQRTVAAAREERERARAEYARALDENVSRDREHELRLEEDRANGRLFRAQGLLGSDAVDTEYQKAVARQIGGLVREEAEQKLNAIAARSDDLQLQKTVAEYQEELSKATYRLIKDFSPAREMLVAEVRKARADARKIIDGQSPDELYATGNP